MARQLATRAAIVTFLLAVGGIAAAQPSTATRFAEEPTAGVDVPTTGLAGEVDALAISANPAGLHFLGGAHLELALDEGFDDDDATGPGQGWGMFLASTIGGNLLPRIGWGMALEFLSPPRVALSPDPGSPTRFSMATSLPLGPTAAFGLAWRHFFDEASGSLHGLDTFDFGLSMRLGAHLAAGAVVRDLGQPTVAGAPVERRYELEVASRPTGDDRLEIGIGGRLGEIRTDFSNGDDIDGWLRASVRVVRGVYLRGQAETRSLFEIAPGPVSDETSTRRETRLTAGLEISFGGMGATGYLSSAVDDDGDGRLGGFTTVVRMSEKDVPAILTPEQRIEQIALKGPLGERELTRMVAKLRLIARDDAVAAVLVQIDGLAAGWGAIDELRQALAQVRAAGKPVYVYMVEGTTKHYFLASVASKIYLDPAGGLRLAGMSTTTLYFKGLFDKLGVLAQFEKIEEYKSAPEAWTRTGPSEPALLERNQLYDSIYDHVVRQIGGGRNIDPARVRTLIDNGPYTSGELRKIPDLVDKVVTPEQLAVEIARDLGAAIPVGSAPDERDERWAYPTIAVVYIDGDIVDGKSSTIPLIGIDLVGSETVAEALAAARNSPSVDAVILRINSPGGSAVASEMIAREVFKTRGVKPIICSLGDVAASGGYFAAAGCDTILADPMTITGSIGIFNGKFEFSGLLGRLGVTWNTFSRGRFADNESLVRPWTDTELALLKRKLHYFYGRFLQTVADGRKLTTTQVDRVGRGRVWTGLQAKPIKLIDGFGGIGDAIALAKRRIGLDPDRRVRLVMLPREEAGLLSWLLGGLARSRAEAREEGERALLEKLLPVGADRLLLRAIPGSVWHQPGSVQARLPFSIVDQ